MHPDDDAPDELRAQPDPAPEDATPPTPPAPPDPEAEEAAALAAAGPAAETTDEVEDEVEDEDDEDEDDEDDDDDEDLEDLEEDLSDYAEFTKLDPNFDHHWAIFNLYLEKRKDPNSPRQRRRRRQARATVDYSKTAAERELAEKQQYTEWEREGIAWFTEQHAAGRFAEWLEGHQVNVSWSVESFAKSYGTAYANHRAYGSSFAGWLDEQSLQYREAAVRLLWQIQRKKLFDLQCRWRAGQVTIPDVSIIEDFEYWDGRLHRCPFLPPITDEEFALYRAYAQSADFEPDLYNAQDYDTFRTEHTAADNAGIAIPEWYLFHNVRTGHDALLLLPDVRGEREMHYRQVLNAHRSARAAAEKAATGEPEVPPPPPPAPPDPRPRLLWHDYHQDTKGNEEHVAYDFLRRFAPEPGVLQHLRAVNSTRFDDRPHIKAAFELLLEVRDTTPIPIEAHADWREALKLTAARYEREQTLAALDIVYDDYRMREQLGLAHAPYNEYPESNRIQLLIGRLDVLKGRILCGEPPEFDY